MQIQCSGYRPTPRFRAKATQADTALIQAQRQGAGNSGDPEMLLSYTIPNWYNLIGWGKLLVEMWQDNQRLKAHIREKGLPLDHSSGGYDYDAYAVYRYPSEKVAQKAIHQFTRRTIPRPFQFKVASVTYPKPQRTGVRIMKLLLPKAHVNTSETGGTPLANGTV